MVKAVIFDADGIILNTENLWSQASKELLVKRGLAWEGDKHKHLMTGLSFEKSSHVFCEIYGIKEDLQSFMQDRQQTIDKYYQQADFMPGFLDFYKKTSLLYKTAIATSSSPHLFEIADKKLGITDLFGGRVYYIAEVENVGKPSPDIFLYAAKKLETDPKDCVVIEDAPNGIEAAKRAGMKVIGMTTTTSAQNLKNADLVVKNFSEIDLGSL